MCDKRGGKHEGVGHGRREHPHPHGALATTVDLWVAPCSGCKSGTRHGTRQVGELEWCLHLQRQQGQGGDGEPGRGHIAQLQVLERTGGEVCGGHVQLTRH